jgi:hypothetical protein
MIKLIDKYDFFYCEETYQKMHCIVDYLIKSYPKYDTIIMNNLHLCVFDLKCKKTFDKTWNNYLQNIYKLSNTSLFFFISEAKKDCIASCTHDRENFS